MRNYGKYFRETAKTFGSPLHFVKNALIKKHTKESGGRLKKTSSERD